LACAPASTARPASGAAAETGAGSSLGSPGTARTVAAGTDIDGWYSGLSPSFCREFSLTEGSAPGTPRLSGSWPPRSAEDVGTRRRRGPLRRDSKLALATTSGSLLDQHNRARRQPARHPTAAIASTGGRCTGTRHLPRGDRLVLAATLTLVRRTIAAVLVGRHGQLFSTRRASVARALVSASGHLAVLAWRHGPELSVRGESAGCNGQTSSAS
jgi:hypothetical protein